MSFKIPKLMESSYAMWVVRFKAYLSMIDEDMEEVLSTGPIIIRQPITRNPENATVSSPTGLENKPRDKWTDIEVKKANLDKVAIHSLYMAIDTNESLFNKVVRCTTAKEIWDKLAEVCEGSKQMRDNRLSVVEEKFNNFQMGPSETLDELDNRFTGIIIELTSLGKKVTYKEMLIKICRSLPSKYLIKTIALRDSPNMDNLSPEEVFASLKAFEFEMNSASDVSKNERISGALIAADSPKAPSKGKIVVLEDDDEVALFHQFKRFMKEGGNINKGQNSLSALNKESFLTL